MKFICLLELDNSVRVSDVERNNNVFKMRQSTERKVLLECLKILVPGI